jgi:hypothetical protein
LANVVVHEDSVVDHSGALALWPADGGGHGRRSLVARLHDVDAGDGVVGDVAEVELPMLVRQLLHRKAQQPLHPHRLHRVHQLARGFVEGQDARSTSSPT